MPAWLRNSIMSVVMVVWTIVILTTLVRHETIEPWWVALPGGIYLAMNPKLNTAKTEDPPPEPPPRRKR